MDITIDNVLPRSTVKATSVVAPNPKDEGGGVGQELPPAGASAEESAEPVEQAVARIQSYVQTIRRDLNFSLDDTTGTVVVKVTDSASGKVIRQLPSEEALRLATSLEEMRSLLFKAEA